MTKRFGTREAIHYVAQNLDANVRTSGAVSFAEDTVPGRPGMYVISIFSYSKCIGRIYWGFEHTPNSAGAGDRITRKATHYTCNNTKWSVTTSKHQTWLGGALAIHQKGAIELVEGPNETANAIALEKAMEHGWLKVTPGLGGVPERILTSREMDDAEVPR